ncbi:hypothetical protein MKX03_031447 [Papaver bracteatum]|nr:hypothetical protein MKX03_031447 [Papaver bracteatum]
MILGSRLLIMRKAIAIFSLSYCRVITCVTEVYWPKCLMCGGVLTKYPALDQLLTSNSLVQVDAVVYLVDAFDKERFAESKKELDALLSDESLATLPFLVSSEEELCYHLGLTNFTTGKGKVNLTDPSVRPIEVCMCSIVRKMGYGDGFKWVSQYIK